jgi:subtilase family serine protease
MHRSSISLLLATACAALFGAAPAWADTTWSTTATQTVLTPPPNADCGAKYELNFYYPRCFDPASVVTMTATAPLHITLGLQLRNRPQLETYLHDVAQPGSPVYAQYLDRDAFMRDYAPTDTQVTAVVTYLSQHGFSGIEVASNHLTITADGTAGGVSSAFNLTMATLTDNGTNPVQHYTVNVGPAQVPDALGGIVAGVLGLTDALSAPDNHHGDYQPPPPGPIAGYGRNPHAYSTIYNADAVSTAHDTTVGIIAAGDMTQTIADLNTFTDRETLPRVDTRVVQVGHGTFGTDGAQDESQVIAATAGQLKQMVFYAIAPIGAKPNQAEVTAAYSRAVADNAVKIIQTSWSLDEESSHRTGQQVIDDAIFLAARAQGQVVMATAGSNLFLDVQNFTIYAPPFEPSTSPNVVAVGGSSVGADGAGHWSTESPWYEMSSSAFPGSRTYYNYWLSPSGPSTYAPVPFWQTPLGNPLPGSPQPPVTGRLAPDLVFDAVKTVPDDWDSTQVLPATTGARIIVNGAEQHLFNGSELATSIFTGLFARIESAHGNRLGLPTPQMYANFASDRSPLHNFGNGEPWQNASCTNTGWTPCAGWGSLDIGKFDGYVTTHWGL